MDLKGYCATIDAFDAYSVIGTQPHASSCLVDDVPELGLLSGYQCCRRSFDGMHELLAHWERGHDQEDCGSQLEDSFMIDSPFHDASPCQTEQQCALSPYQSPAPFFVSRSSHAYYCSQSSLAPLQLREPNSRQYDATISKMQQIHGDLTRLPPLTGIARMPANVEAPFDPSWHTRFWNEGHIGPFTSQSSSTGPSDAWDNVSRSSSLMSASPRKFVLGNGTYHDDQGSFEGRVMQIRNDATRYNEGKGICHGDGESNASNALMVAMMEGAVGERSRSSIRKIVPTSDDESAESLLGAEVDALDSDRDHGGPSPFDSDSELSAPPSPSPPPTSSPDHPKLDSDVLYPWERTSSKPRPNYRLSSSSPSPLSSPVKQKPKGIPAKKQTKKYTGLKFKAVGTNKVRKGKKEKEGKLPTTTSASFPASRRNAASFEEEALIHCYVCPTPGCIKRYRNRPGLKYHQTLGTCEFDEVIIDA